MCQFVATSLHHGFVHDTHSIGMVSILTKIESLCIPLTKADSGGFEPLSLRSAIFILRGGLHNWARTILLSSSRKQIAVFARNYYGEH